MNEPILTAAAAASAVLLVAALTTARWLAPGDSAGGQTTRSAAPPVGRGRLRRGRRSRRGAPTEALIDALDAIARQVRAGHSLSAASASVPLPADGVPSADLSIAHHAMALADQVGGTVAAAVDSAAATLRARQAVRDEVAAHSAQARLSVRVLTLLPFAVALWTASSPRGRAAFGSPAGVVCVVAGSVLAGIGWWWMRRLIRAVAS